MLTDAEQLERRAAIVRILRGGLVRKQADLVRLLKKEGHAARSPPSAATCATSGCSRRAGAMRCRRMR